jgi:exopolysaccharide biosynthesis polyprenyl glycosylphosphotransferase
MNLYLFNYNKKRKYFLCFCDIIVLSLALFVSYSIRVYINQKNPSLDAVLSKFNPWQTIVVLIHLCTLYLLDQYNLDQLINLIGSSLKIVLSVFCAGLVISGIFFFLPKYVFGRQVLLIHLIVTSLFMVLWRLFYACIMIRGTKPKRLAVLGGGHIISSFIEELARIPNSGLDVTSICVSDNPSTIECLLPETPSYHEGVQEFLKSNDFDVLAFDSANGSFSDKETRLILQLKYRGKAVFDLSNLYKNLTGKVPLTYIDGRWLLNNDGFQGKENLPYVRAKRMIDILLSILLLVITSPIFLIITVAIILDSKGNIFFVQERLGLEKKPFNCVKFRTMVENAEHKSGPVWSRENDPRITQVGRFLRKSRLDELPQLWNILKGDMSFVGPRPIREHFARELAKKIPFYGLRFSVKPGLSGWAQVNRDYAGTEEGQLDKFQYELFYIENMSLFLDILTAFKTIQIVLKGEGT